MQKILSDSRKTLEIDYEKCVKCGLCAKSCTCQLMIMDGENPRPMKERTSNEMRNRQIISYIAPTCANCRVCIIVCPKDAIRILADLTGTNYDEKLPEASRMYPRD